jgi:hypothetical protein
VLRLARLALEEQFGRASVTHLSRDTAGGERRVNGECATLAGPRSRR